jgi:hypothetical protein
VVTITDEEVGELVEVRIGVFVGVRVIVLV